MIKKNMTHRAAVTVAAVLTVALALIATQPAAVVAYPTSLTSTSGCTKYPTLKVGAKLMLGDPAVLSSERTVVIRRCGKALNGTGPHKYASNETLTVDTSDGKGIQYVFEQTGAMFKGGKCSGKRSIAMGDTRTVEPAVLIMPTDGATVTIVQGFQNQPAAVKVTETVTLVHDPSMVNTNCSTPNPPKPPVPGDKNKRLYPVFAVCGVGMAFFAWQFNRYRQSTDAAHADETNNMYQKF